MPLHIVRRRDGDETPVRADANRDHVLVDTFAQTDPGVEALLDNVAHGVVAVEFDSDVGIVA